MKAQTMLTVARLKRERAFAELLGANALKIVGGYYDLESAKVDIVA